MVISKRSEFTFLNSFSAWCLLACRKGNTVVPQGKNVKDGTRCYSNPSKKDVCIQGKCMVRRCSCLKYEYRRRLSSKSWDIFHSEVMITIIWSTWLQRPAYELGIRCTTLTWRRSWGKGQREQRKGERTFCFSPSPSTSNPFPLNP